MIDAQTIHEASVALDSKITSGSYFLVTFDGDELTCIGNGARLQTIDQLRRAADILEKRLDQHVPPGVFRHTEAR